jgi:hypothetical protein
MTYVVVALPCRRFFGVLRWIGDDYSTRYRFKIESSTNAFGLVAKWYY